MGSCEELVKYIFIVLVEIGSVHLTHRPEQTNLNQPYPTQGLRLILVGWWVGFGFIVFQPV